KLAVTDAMQLPVNVKTILTHAHPGDIEPDACGKFSEDALEPPLEVVDRALRAANLTAEPRFGGILPRNLNCITIGHGRQNVAESFHQRNITIDDIAEAKFYAGLTSDN